MECPSCAAAIPESSRFCASCGAALDRSLVPTIDSEPQAAGKTETARSSPRTSKLISSDSFQSGRFTAGTILGERYRIVGLLGRGGMGEVYRAEDLKLSQEVALKFLPAKTAGDEKTLAKFYREVRIARQITHANVCRVFDISEADGLHFISMEFVDGEDLGSLLRRIGRFPSDKGIEIARQICAGLAAAHGIGVLHRDLKPANIMLDGRGKVRVTDFGLAGLAEEFSEGPLVVGTPAYMAPEQLAGKEITYQSDIYSLGLVLFEIFTGKRVYEVTTIEQLLRMHREVTPTIPDNLSREIDPVIERVLLRCLAKDPASRPSSVLQVAAALPGGDPLAAALAAGETPSPEVVAASAKEGALRPATALVCAGAIVFQVIFFLATAKYVRLESFISMEKSPAVLRDRGETIAKEFGYSSFADSEGFFVLEEDYWHYARTHKEIPDRYRRMVTGQPLSLAYAYRQSPTFMLPNGLTRLQWSNPPLDVPGMIKLMVDPKGRLVEFQAFPPDKPESIAKDLSPDWSELFAEAGLDPVKFKESEPQWTPPLYAQQRYAWTGAYPDHPDMPIRVEGAGFQGKPVFFRIVGPWHKPLEYGSRNPLGPGQKAAFAILISAIFVVMLGAVFLARRNLRLGRGDQKGAFRLAVFLFTAAFCGFAIKAHHMPDVMAETLLTFECIKAALFYSIPFWLLYVALEPYVRRLWPNLLISWTRVLTGNFHDPMVGRDILVGTILGLANTLLISLSMLIPGWMGDVFRPELVAQYQTLLGIRQSVGLLLSDSIPRTVFFSLFYLFLLFLFFAIVRRERVAIFIAWVLISVIVYLAFATESHPIRLLLTPISAALPAIAVSRFGLLAAASFQLTFFVSSGFPITGDLSAPFAASGFLGLAIIAALTVYGFRTALAGRPVFGKLLPA